MTNVVALVRIFWRQKVRRKKICVFVAFRRFSPRRCFFASTQKMTFIVAHQRRQRRRCRRRRLRRRCQRRQRRRCRRRRFSAKF